MGTETRTASQARDAILEAFAASWQSNGESLDIVLWGNIGEDPKSLDEYALATVTHATGDIAALGAGPEVMVRRQAVFACEIAVRHGSGKGRCLELAEKALDFVESARIAGIRLRNPGLVENGRLGDRYRSNVTAQIEYDSYRTV